MGRVLAIIFVAAIITAPAGSAYSQDFKGTQARAAADERAEQRERRTVEQEYKAAMERTKKSGSTVSTDPWGNVREVSPPKKKAKPASGEAKSGQ